MHSKVVSPDTHIVSGRTTWVYKTWGKIRRDRNRTEKKEWGLYILHLTYMNGRYTIFEQYNVQFIFVEYTACF
jgi:hypothetical protein